MDVEVGGAVHDTYMACAGPAGPQGETGKPGVEGPTGQCDVYRCMLVDYGTIVCLCPEMLDTCASRYTQAQKRSDWHAYKRKAGGTRSEILENEVHLQYMLACMWVCKHTVIVSV